MHQIPYFADKEGNTVIFRKVKNVPGFTHRVIVNDQAAGWLAQGFKPNAKNAQYFLRRTLDVDFYGRGKK